jgi:carbonic anhydrase
MLDHLLKGMHQFRTQVFANELEFYQQLAKGQSPRVLVITCSDSRVVPDLILQAAPGELFTIRNAGNLIPAYGASNGGESASLEYAVAALQVEHIVVCGHSQCGAIKALLDPSQTERLPVVRDWLKHAETTRRIIAENYAALSGPALLEAAVQENVLVQIENLQTHPSVAARLQRGGLELHAWMYALETGEIRAFSSTTETFEPLGPTTRGLGGQPSRAPQPTRRKKTAVKRRTKKPSP